MAASSIPPATTRVPSSSGTMNASSIPNLRDRIPKLQPRRRAAAPANPTPAPPTPSLLPPTATPEKLGDFQFAIPRRRILSQNDHEIFLESATCTLLQAWVFGLAESVVDTPAGVFADALAAAAAARQTRTELPEDIPGQWRPGQQQQRTYQKNLPQRPLSPVVLALLSILDEAEALVYANPPDDAGGSRFGNKRFRGFVDQVRQRAVQWHKEELGMKEKETAKDEGEREGASEGVSAIAEAAAYLAQAFGNRARIDYGSGHELHFVVWLLCLYQLGLVSRDDMPALVLCVFTRYLDVMRLVQTTYYLEPAGSHGVWGLDDYQFLPFLFGAAQLLHHRYITPRAVHQPLTLEQFGDDYLYLGQVRFVNSIKAASTTNVVQVGDGEKLTAGGGGSGDYSLRWHSPMLDDISATKTWEKVEGGMRRMFVAEVLRKLPVMQHFLFGSLVPAAPSMTLPREGKEAGEAGADVDDEDEDAIVDGNDTVDVFQEGGVRHIHNPSGWGDCCGIRVPSSLGAAGEMRKNGREALRRIPFD
ncbi:peptidylprolyl isomerase [Sporothrix brasiliensis 5110]|uniref:Serine/threonine-protein phosphatase 2A activator n=1 Tax=Sporothrix brasiliensis 5110 TaxID=1398154 RepID=A0A0C2FBQ5_9PEZI|nr:peptidylprolyl isomerase [Sporothrix brasiliensis 5110]KIH88508.1 peptidylprolyl isomerase [Sporothrix brasiliensis 5110]